MIRIWSFLFFSLSNQQTIVLMCVFLLSRSNIGLVGDALCVSQFVTSANAVFLQMPCEVLNPFAFLGLLQNPSNVRRAMFELAGRCSRMPRSQPELWVAPSAHTTNIPGRRQQGGYKGSLDHLKEGRKSDDSFQGLSMVASCHAFTLLVAAWASAQLATKAQPDNVLATLVKFDCYYSNACCKSLSPCLGHGNSTMVWTCKGRKQQLTLHLVASYERLTHTHTHILAAPPIFECVFTFTFVTAVSCLVVCFWCRLGRFLSIFFVCYHVYRSHVCNVVPLPRETRTCLQLVCASFDFNTLQAMYDRVGWSWGVGESVKLWNCSGQQVDARHRRLTVLFHSSAQQVEHAPLERFSLHASVRNYV